MLRWSMVLRLCAVAICCAGFGTTAVADSPDEFTYSLFDGKSLDGWNIENKCEADVVDGQLRLKAGNGWLRSDHQYSDFKLHVEWKALQAAKYDAGIFIRSAGEGDPYPKPSYQINLLQGKEGNIGSLSGATSTGLVKEGDWNAFDITVVGDTVALEINGKPAYKTGGLTAKTGYVGFQIEVPAGGQYLIRNIRMTELNAKALFNGKDLAGWEGVGDPAEKCWKVADGLLLCTGEKGPWIRSAAEYGDFNLRLDYQVDVGGNSGVYVRVPADGNHHRDNDTLPPAGFEVQVLDDAAPQYKDLKDYQFSASVYDIAGAQPHVSKPHGQWNTLEINCQGGNITTTHNGKVVTKVTPETHPKSKLRMLKGFLGLQNHSSLVKFRNVRVGGPQP
ncbi:MAG: hypothetical protein JWN70_4155 [Planctomycetaceae bacterium]|nr:hypothetical protein [Planctomycetaceae bacterium]